MSGASFAVAFDPTIVTIGTGFVASILVGRAAIYGLDLVPGRWRRTAEWLLVIGAALAAILGDFWSSGPVGRLAFAFLVAVLPGALAYIVFRTALAAAVLSLLPVYFAIGALTQGRAIHAPAVFLDHAVPVQPDWMLVYGSLYVFVLLPVVVVRPRELFLRALKAYVMVMLIAYVGFLVYPTIAPRPATVLADGFFAWCLRLTYSLDTPYNCFPSLHVANSFISALACYRVHRKLGAIAIVWAALIGVSTLFTKQHYAVDVIAGVLMALAAYVLFLRGYPREGVDESDRRLAPRRALAAVAMYGAVLTCFWIMYRTGMVVV